MSQTAELLDALASYFRRFVVLTDDQLAALVLWTAHTYVYEIADTTPYLIVTSAEKGSGKTRVIEAMHHVAHKPESVTALTEAVLFRIVSQEKPTLLIDETDAIFRDHKGGPSEKQEGLRSILNAGYRRGTLIARVMPNQEIGRFACFCPKLLAGIGHLPDTIEHRGLNIRLTRKRKEDTIERLRFREVSNGTTHALRQALGEWAPGARLALEGRYPEMPDALDDRAQDSYEILVAIADFAGESWGETARDVLVRLRTSYESAQESLGMKLLRDVALFAETLASTERIPTDDLLGLLYEEGESPWEDWWKSESGKKAPRRLALAFKEYGIEPEKWKLNGVTKRGYATGPIVSLLARYVDDTPLTPPSGDLQDFSEISTRHFDDQGGVLKSAHLQGSGVSGVLDAPQPSMAEYQETLLLLQARTGRYDFTVQEVLDELRAQAEFPDF